MTKMGVKYQGSLRTICTHYKSGDEITTDAPVDNHGKGEAFSPTDLLGASLISCMITVMAIAAQNRGKKIKKMEGEVEKTMFSNPRRIGKLAIVLTIEDMGYTEKERAILDRAAIDCPVALSLHPELEQDVTIKYV